MNKVNIFASSSMSMTEWVWLSLALQSLQLNETRSVDIPNSIHLFIGALLR